ncbi:sialate O-acetylesterase [Siphonobacter sp. BAB-5405]|uniref:sialate O-acetylesterase n=1 Tax=Siphonobacter sp. BAB-5405 TaxID=1864825 RepID=UPI001304FB16|nr:sialate O-acetylesterase [Siphonobacter sp. BAB-5405]
MTLKSIFKYGLSLCCLAFSTSAFSQLKITFPVERIVFQRNNGNSANVTVAGSFSNNAERIEARFVARNGGVTTNWTPIAAGSGNFQGTVFVSGGWYNVEVRALSGGNVLESTTLERVGVGEVFVIAGQSNAQGRTEQNDSPAPQDDRINVISNFSNNGESNQDPGSAFPVFKKMTQNELYAPYGQTAWHWGHLGDLLTARLNVPVLFINSAYSATGAYNWAESAQGKTTYFPFADKTPMPAGMPYANLRISLQYYTNLTGVRSVLWHQGEWDGLNGTAAQTYYNQIKTVIDKSRSDLGGKNVSWMIARASMYPSGVTQVSSRASVIQGQNMAIQQAGNCFAGPETDNIQNPRDAADLWHFSGPENHKKHAQAWFESIVNSNFLSSSQPQAAANMLQVTFACRAKNQFNLSIAGRSGQYYWISSDGNNKTDGTIVGQSGKTYYARVKDGIGNSAFAPPFIVPNDIGTPSVVANSTTFCVGSRVTLTANGGGNIFVWNNGQTGKTITVNQPGAYSVRINDGNGCESPTSAAVQITQTEPGPGPALTSSTKVICPGSAATLSAPAGKNYVWSTGETGTSISVKTAGSYTAKEKDPTTGCESLNSSALVLTMGTLPTAPTITTSDKIKDICPGTEVTLAASNGINYRWNTSQDNTATLTVKQGGSYTAQSIDNDGCVSLASNAIVVSYSPKPDKPNIAASGAVAFCDGKNVTLTASQGNSYVWSNQSDSRAITVSESGEFTVYTVNANGCRSDASDKVVVTVHPLPAKPTVVAQGPTAICSGAAVTLASSVTAASYQWSNGASGSSIQTTQAGTYSVTVKDAFGCGSASSDPVTVTVNPRPEKPRITVVGSTTFCEDKSVTLQAVSSEAAVVWNTGETGQSLIISKAGSFSVQAKNTFNCLSATSDAVTTSVRPLPAAPTITASGALEFCEGGTVTLTSNNNSLKHTWIGTSDAGNRVTVQQSGNYTAQVTDNIGCTSPVSNVLTVKVNPLPTEPTITKVGTYKLQAGGTGKNFYWKRGTDSLTTDEAVIKATATGTYSVRSELVYTLSSGRTLSCYSAKNSTLNFVLDPLSQDISIYPNPSTNGRVTLETLKGLKNVTVRLFTPTGHPILEKKIGSLDDTQTIEIQDNSGLLILVIDADGFHTSRRIMVNSL